MDAFFSWYNGQIALHVEGHAAADVAHRYLWGPAVDQLLADEQVSSLTSAGDVLWPLSDHLGTTRDLATYDAQAGTLTLANHRRFDAYGRLVASSTTITTPFGYTGALYEAASGLQYNRARWYDAATGRWVSEDPIGFGGGDTNLGRYVRNSPTNFTDPSGLAPPFIILGQNCTSYRPPVQPRMPLRQSDFVSVEKVKGQQGCVDVVVYDAEDNNELLSDAYKKTIAKGTYKQDIAIPIGKDMNNKTIFSEIRSQVGQYKIRNLYFWDHGGAAGQGQRMGTATITPDDFNSISHLFTPNSRIFLFGCGLGAPGYKRYRWEIMKNTGAPVTGPNGFNAPNNTGGEFYFKSKSNAYGQWGKLITTWPSAPEPLCLPTDESQLCTPYESPSSMQIPPWAFDSDDE